MNITATQGCCPGMNTEYKNSFYGNCCFLLRIIKLIIEFLKFEKVSVPLGCYAVWVRLLHLGWSQG